MENISKKLYQLSPFSLSELYSWYVNHIARASALYGSLSVLLLMLLWLYACLSILFYGALLNHLLFDRPEPEERCACSDT